MNRTQEFAVKRERVVALLDRLGAAALLLRTEGNIAWLGCGPADDAPLASVQGSRGQIWHQTDTAVMAFIVDRKRTVLVTENIELPRLVRDEFPELPLEVLAQPWPESDLAVALEALVVGDNKLVVTDLAETPLVAATAARGLILRDERAAITALRSALLPREIDRYRWLGRVAAETMSAICREITPGMPEAEVVAAAHARLHRLGIAQEVDIVCADDRLRTDRHALYGDYAINRLAMVVFCAHKWGLVANLTRMVHLGSVSADLRRRHQTLAALDAQIMNATRPGVPLAEVFATLQRGYAALGAPEAWRDHHQGGSTGYSGRDVRVTPTSSGAVALHQAFAWNPSLPEIKSEDTFIVDVDGAEVLTLDPTWPVYPENGRPAILELPPA